MNTHSQIVALCNQSIEQCHQILEQLGRLVVRYEILGKEPPQRVHDLITETRAQISDCQMLLKRVAS